MFVVVCCSSPGYKPFIASLLEQGPPAPPPTHTHTDSVTRWHGSVRRHCRRRKAECGAGVRTSAVHTGDKTHQIPPMSLSARPEFFLEHSPRRPERAQAAFQTWKARRLTLHLSASRHFYILTVSQSPNLRGMAFPPPFPPTPAHSDASISSSSHSQAGCMQILSKDGGSCGGWGGGSL